MTVKGWPASTDWKRPGTGLSVGDGGDEIGEGNAARMGRSEGREQVENVDFAGEARDDLGRACGGFEMEDRAGGSERVTGGAPVAFADAVGADFCAGFARGGGEFIGVVVVGVDYCDARCWIDRAVEEQALGGEVLLHGLVIVEMVAGEIGENGYVEIDSGDAALVEAMAGNFGDELGGSAADAFGHQLEEVARLGRGVDGRADFAGQMIFNCPDENGGARGGVEEGFGEEGGCRLAVGAGDAGGGERALGMAEECSGGLGQRAAAMFDFEDRQASLVDGYVVEGWG